MKKRYLILAALTLLIAGLVVAEGGSGNTIQLFVNAITGPNSGTAMTGQEVQLVVNVVGRSPFNYLWRKDGISIGAPDSSIYTIASAALTDAGDYDCVATSAGGQPITSTTATLTVLQSLKITQQPTNLTVHETEKATFKVVVAANGTASYQWEKYDGTSAWDPVGVNADTYQIPASALADAGKYRCTITDETPLTVTTVEVTLAVLAAGVYPDLKITFDAASPGQLTNGVFNLREADFLSLFQDQAGVTAAGGSPATVTAIVIRLVPIPVSVAPALAGVPEPQGDTAPVIFSHGSLTTSFSGRILVGFRFNGLTTNYNVRNDLVKVRLTYSGTADLANDDTGWLLNLTAPLP